MQYFNFSRLVSKYKSEFKSITLTGGYFDDRGDWIDDFKSQTTIEGAIISIKENKIYRAEGTLTEKDKRLFTLMSIDSEALQSSKIIYDGNVYSIESSSDNSKFTGVWAYTLKWVSAFKDDSPEYDLTEDADKLNQRLDGTYTPSIPDDTDSEYPYDKLSKRLNGTHAETVK